MQKTKARFSVLIIYTFARKQNALITKQSGLTAWRGKTSTELRQNIPWEFPARLIKSVLMICLDEAKTRAQAQRTLDQMYAPQPSFQDDHSMLIVSDSMSGHAIGVLKHLIL